MAASIPNQGSEGYSTGLASLPAGFRFKPTVPELMTYLRAKTDGGASHCPIKDVKVYDYEPSKLPAVLPEDRSDGKKYFFTSLEKVQKASGTKRKAPVGKNIKRTAPGGTWKIQTSPSYVCHQDKKTIGTKTALAYYVKLENSELQKTDWLMKQFRLSQPFNHNDDESNMWALCVVYRKKQGSKNIKQEGTESTDHHGNPNQCSIPNIIVGSSPTSSSNPVTVESELAVNIAPFSPTRFSTMDINANHYVTHYSDQQSNPVGLGMNPPMQYAVPYDETNIYDWTSNYLAVRGGMVTINNIMETLT